jgi:hypothetical protein
MANTFTFSMHLEIDDEDTLYAEALRHATAVDCLSQQEAEELLCPNGERDMGACISMLLDPGYIPGCDIHESWVD